MAEGSARYTGELARMILFTSSTLELCVILINLMNAISSSQAQLVEENQAKLRLQMELDSKDSEIETLQMKIASLNSETASVSSIENDGEDSVLSEHGTMRLEGWLNVPNKQNIKRHGWKKQYVVVSSKKIIFYNSENDKMNADPVLILDLNKVFHVRSVTQGDVIRANAKDIPRIFQVGTSYLAYDDNQIFFISLHDSLI